MELPEDMVVEIRGAAEYVLERWRFAPLTLRRITVALPEVLEVGLEVDILLRLAVVEFLAAVDGLRGSLLVVLWRLLPLELLLGSDSLPTPAP